MRFRIKGRLIHIPSFLLFIIGLIVLSIILLTGYYLSKKDKEIILYNSSMPSTSFEAQEKEEVVLISVHIIGCVNEKRVVRIPLGSTVEEAIFAAGGFTEDADKEALNLAFRLSDGMQVRVPSINDQDKSWLIEGTMESSVKVNINTGNLKQLMTLPGVGESTAKKIIAYREENGYFKRIEDIMLVAGIKEAKFESLKDFICV